MKVCIGLLYSNGLVSSITSESINDGSFEYPVEVENVTWEEYISEVNYIPSKHFQLGLYKDCNNLMVAKCTFDMVEGDILGSCDIVSDDLPVVTDDLRIVHTKEVTEHLLPRIGNECWELSIYDFPPHYKYNKETLMDDCKEHVKAVVLGSNYNALNYFDPRNIEVLDICSPTVYCYGYIPDNVNEFLRRMTSFREKWGRDCFCSLKRLRACKEYIDTLCTLFDLPRLELLCVESYPGECDLDLAQTTIYNHPCQGVKSSKGRTRIDPDKDDIYKEYLSRKPSKYTIEYDRGIEYIDLVEDLTAITVSEKLAVKVTIVLEYDVLGTVLMSRSKLNLIADFKHYSGVKSGYKA